MERLIIAMLPEHRYPAVVRYGGTLGLLGVAFLFRIVLRDQLQHYPMLLFIPVIFISALVFDKGSGFFATFVSAMMAAYFFMGPRESLDPGRTAATPLALYVLIGCIISAVTEALQRTAKKLHQSEKRQRLLLEELRHRTKNDLMMVTSVLTLQARGLIDPSARVALDSAIARIGVIAKAHEQLRTVDNEGRVAIAAYLENLCHGLGELLRDVRPIAVRVRADPLDMPTSQAVSIGLVVNELVTNALKYAYPGSDGGVVQVELRKHGDGLNLVVEDDGVGCPIVAETGLGSRLVRLVAAQLGGVVERQIVPKGCRVAIHFPRVASGD